MSDLSFSFIDVVVVLIVLASAIYAAYRGFVSETLSILAWVAGAFAALYFGPAATALLADRISPHWLAPVAGYLGVFLAAVIPLSFVSHRIAQSVKASPVSTLDGTLGAVFGVVRGLAIIGFVYFVFTAFVPIRDQPAYVAQARTLPLIQGSSAILLSLVPQGSRDLLGASRIPVDTATAGRPRSISAEDGHKAAPAHRAKKGYGTAERRALDNLIEATGSGEDVKP